MDFNDIEQIKEEGFLGFRTMRELFLDSSSVPKIRGVYMVLNPERRSEFLEIGIGGFFKGKDPNVSIAELELKWVNNAWLFILEKQEKKEAALHFNQD